MLLENTKRPKKKKTLNSRMTLQIYLKMTWLVGFVAANLKLTNWFGIFWRFLKLKYVLDKSPFSFAH